jgi:RimJ/RimL family protein N-acetyltransferase
VIRKFIYGQDRFLATWAADQIKAGGGFSSDVKAIGVEIDGELAAVTLWDYITRYNCVLSIASDGSRRWMTREYLFRTFAYPFIQLNLNVVTCLIAESNKDSLRLCEHVGFKRIGRIPEASGADDDIVLCMTKRDCRWIAPEFAKHSKPIVEGE